MNLVDKVINPDETRTELTKALRRSLGVNSKHRRSKRNLANWAYGF